MSFFKTGVLIAFGIFALIGVALFALGGFTFTDEGPDIGSVTIWGTVPESQMDALITGAERGGASELSSKITYEQKSPEQYEQELLNALAAGGGPDLMVLSQDQILSFDDKIQRIPFEAFSQRQFRNTFVEGAELYLSNNGVIGMPITVDPLVFYWNRSIFSGAGVANAPRFWSELVTLSERITQRDDAGNITRATVAMGGYENVNHAKDIISTLIMQAGGDIVGQGQRGDLTSFLNQGGATSPGQTALRFYTEFANPVKTIYTWNRGLPQAQQEFTAGDLATYLGYASELPMLREANPNLNFDVATLPQSREGDTRLTFGKFNALAIPRQASNPRGAMQVAILLSERDAVSFHAEETVYPPVRRDLLGDTPSGAYESVFYDAALTANAWLDPAPEETDIIFADLVRQITSGSQSIGQALNGADRRIEALLR